MVDWLEELLAAVDSEDEDGQEDALALALEGAASPAPAPVPGDEAEDGGLEQTEGLGRPGDAPPPPRAGGGEAQAGPRDRIEPPGERRQLGGAPPEAAPDTLGRALAGRGRKAQALGAADPRAGEAAEAGAWPAGTAEAGLERLYRRTAQAGRLPAQGMAGGTAAWTRPEKEPGQTAALTVDELDRAVKRDSRRYDGGMSIF